jgi:hypothetical protein
MRNPVKVGIWGGVAAAIGTFVFKAIASIASLLVAVVLFMFTLVLLLGYVVPTIP